MLLKYFLSKFVADNVWRHWLSYPAWCPARDNSTLHLINRESLSQLVFLNFVEMAPTPLQLKTARNQSSWQVKDNKFPHKPSRIQFSSPGLMSLFNILNVIKIVTSLLIIFEKQSCVMIDQLQGLLCPYGQTVESRQFAISILHQKRRGGPSKIVATPGHKEKK